MAGSSSRSTRRSTRNSESPNDNTALAKSETFSASESVTEITIPISPLESPSNIGAIESTEDVSSESGSSSSSKSRNGSTSSESSSTTSEESLQKSKEELIQTARELDSQLKDLVKIYQHETKLFIDKSIHLMETDSHPDWAAKMEELQTKRRNALKIAAERQRLRIDAVLAEHDFTIKNVADELEAAEKEIIDEFTSKRKRKAVPEPQRPLNFPAERKNSVPRVALKAEQIDNDLNMINRAAESAIQAEEAKEL